MTEQTLVSSKNDLAVYPVLVRRVREAIAEGKRRAEDAVETEKVRDSWEIGKLIHEHILLNKDRADYGQQVLKRLSADIGMSITELQYMVQFAKTYPISPAPGKLTWSKYRDLLAVNDSAEREKLITQAVKNKWSDDELRREIGKRKAAKKITTTDIPVEELLQPKRGKLGVYRVIEVGKKKAYDLGFSTYLEVKGRAPKQIDPPTEDLYTYEAEVEEVIDGDTLWAKIHLGFGVWTHQKLRLRGLDCPEINSREGQGAKRFVERQLHSSLRGVKQSKAEAISSPVVITSTKSDKYDRYLADVFLPLRSVKTSSGGTRATKHEYTQDTYLNNELLKRGFAVAVRG